MNLVAHQNVLGCDFFTQAAVELHPPPAISQGDGYCTLGLFLTNDVFIELVNYLTGSHCRHGRSVSVVGRQHFKGAVVIGVDADVGGNIEAFLDDLVGGQLRVLE